jgi:hypothetical protein
MFALDLGWRKFLGHDAARHGRPFVDGLDFYAAHRAAPIWRVIVPKTAPATRAPQIGFGVVGTHRGRPLRQMETGGEA